MGTGSWTSRPCRGAGCWCLSSPRPSRGGPRSRWGWRTVTRPAGSWSGSGTAWTPEEGIIGFLKYCYKSRLTCILEKVNFPSWIVGSLTLIFLRYCEQIVITMIVLKIIIDVLKSRLLKHNSQNCNAPVFLCIDVSRVKERNSYHGHGRGDGQRCDPSEESSHCVIIFFSNASVFPHLRRTPITPVNPRSTWKSDATQIAPWISLIRICQISNLATNID